MTISTKQVDRHFRGAIAHPTIVAPAAVWDPRSPHGSLGISGTSRVSPRESTTVRTLEIEHTGQYGGVQLETIGPFSGISSVLKSQMGFGKAQPLQAAGFMAGAGEEIHGGEGGFGAVVLGGIFGIVVLLGAFLGTSAEPQDYHGTHLPAETIQSTTLTAAR
ncbi:hypothetical protein [Corynebacterium phocae]|nr:hypothetical protein [Corynebacterium phocae]